MRRVLVTGGLGFVGSRLCAQLAERGHEVVCIDRLGASYSRGAGPDAARSLSATPRVRVVVADLERLGLVWNVVRVSPERQAAKATG